MPSLHPCAPAAPLLISPTLRVTSAATETGGAASRLVDGKKTVCMQTKSSTDAVLGAWATIDLLSVKAVRTIILTNRQGGAQVEGCVGDACACPAPHA